MNLLRLDLTTSFERAQRAEDPHRFLAGKIAGKLERVAPSLYERNLPFEAGEAESLAQRFRDEGDFHDCWADLVEWGEAVVVSGGREKSLCKISDLPRELA